MSHEFIIESTEPGSLAGGPCVNVACECGGWRGTAHVRPGPIAARDLEWMRAAHFEHKLFPNRK